MKESALYLLLLFLLTAGCLTQTYNTSLCTDILIGDLHYYINANSDNQNIVKDLNGSQLVYNLCKQVEVYCPYANAVVNASMVLTSPLNRTCIPFTQTSVGLIDQEDVSSGITVTYLAPNNQQIVINTTCMGGEGFGCPTVQ